MQHNIIAAAKPQIYRQDAAAPRPASDSTPAVTSIVAVTALRSIYSSQPESEQQPPDKPFNEGMLPGGRIGSAIGAGINLSTATGFFGRVLDDTRSLLHGHPCEHGFRDMDQAHPRPARL